MIKQEIISLIEEEAYDMDGVNTIEVEHKGYSAEALTRTNHRYSPGTGDIPESWDTEVEIMTLKITENE